MTPLLLKYNLQPINWQKIKRTLDKLSSFLHYATPTRLLQVFFCLFSDFFHFSRNALLSVPFQTFYFVYFINSNICMKESSTKSTEGKFKSQVDKIKRDR